MIQKKGTEQKKIRLDKYVADASGKTRSQVKLFIKAGRISINEEQVKVADFKVDVETDCVALDGKQLSYETYEYWMFHKPAGCVSATEDNVNPTVLDYIKEEDSPKKGMLFPVGRLDKDTEGLLLLTNDGGLAHNLLSPKKHIAKTYLVKLDQPIMESEKNMLEQGVDIGDERQTLPAQLEYTDQEVWVLLTIIEGRFHQVKRMFQAVDHQVLYLKRISMDTLALDDTLLPGEYRRLTTNEVNCLKNRMDEKIC